MIYVDRIEEYPSVMIKDGAKKYGKKWCHMMTDGRLKELHEMAEKIGLRREWFQDSYHPHYDLVSSKKTLDIRFGAKEVSARDILKICGRKG